MWWAHHLMFFLFFFISVFFPFFAWGLLFLSPQRNSRSKPTLRKINGARPCFRGCVFFLFQSVTASSGQFISFHFGWARSLYTRYLSVFLLCPHFSLGAARPAPLWGNELGIAVPVGFLELVHAANFYREITKREGLCLLCFFL